MKLHKFSLVLGCLLSGAALFAQPASLPLDKEVVTGRLDNGISYMIKHNAKLRGQACFYFVNGIGALAEKADEHGMAHYLEHMMFQGTTNFPGHGMTEMLERHGVLYGYDLNAHTSENETVYTLSHVPTHDARLLDSCLMVMRDWVYALELSDDRIEHERGPILRELAMRNTPDNRIQTQWANSLLKGSAYEGHDVLGTPADIKAVTPDGMRRFYQSWHNSAMVNVVVVGDFDVTQMETALKRILAGVPMGDKTRPRPFFAIPDRDTLNYCVATDPGKRGESVMVINLVRDTPEAEKSTAAYLVSGIMARMVNSMGAARMSQIVRGQSSPFGGAAISAIPLKRGYFTYQLGASLRQTGDEARAVRLLLLEYERLKQVGFTEREFERAKAQMLRDNLRAATVDKTNDELAKMLEQNYLEGEPMIDYRAWNDFERGVLDTLTVASVNSMLRAWSTDRNISVVITGPEGMTTPTKQDVLDMFAQVKKIDYRHFVFEPEPETPLPVLPEVQPKAGRIKKQLVDKTTGTTTWRLANGTTVVYKQVPGDRAKVCLREVRPGGESMFSIDQLPSAQVATRFVEAGGVGTLSSQQLSRVQEAEAFKVDSRIYGYSSRMEGMSLPNSVEQMLRLLYLRFTQPVIDTMVINRSMEQNRIYAHFPASAQQRLQDTVLVLRGGGHPRLLSQRGNYFDNITSASITDAWNKCFGAASGYTFVITGAQPADSLRPLVEKYIASLPALAGKAKWIDHGMYGYRGVTERTVNTGVMGGAAMVVIGISAPMSYTPANELKNRIVARIVQQRAMNEMREKSGDVYTINVNQESRSVPRGAFEVSAEFQADTVNAETLRDKVYGIWTQLVQGGVTQAEVSAALAYFAKTYLEEGDKANRWADVLANRVVDGCDRLDSDNFERTAAQVNATAVNAYIKTMDTNKNVVRLIFR